MVIGVLKEIKGNEYRVAAVPATVHEIVRHGHTVYVETGAGVGSGFSDAQYEAAGAIIADTNTVWEKADLYYKVKELFPQEFKWMNKDKILFTYIHSNAHPDETDTLLNSHVSAVAYEDVQDEEGKFPLLRPMSELAGKGGFLAALHFAQSVNGGPGKLLANVTGVETPIITMLGCGVVGTGAAELAAAFGNEVRILDVNMNTMLAAKKTSPANITYMISNRSNLEKCLRESDVIINGILWAKDRKDHIVYREDLKLMKPGAMIVDVACDENGGIDTGVNGGYGINVRNGATLTINGGYYYGGGTAVQVQEGTLIINGGTFACEPYSSPTYGYNFLINCLDSAYKNGTAKVIINGGTFVNFDPSNCTAEGAGTNFVADGYKVVSAPQTNGDVWYTVVKG